MIAMVGVVNSGKTKQVMFRFVHFLHAEETAAICAPLSVVS
jgi:hypothetical protein